MANTCMTIYIEPHNCIISEFLLVSRLSRAVAFAIIKFIFGGTCGILVVGFPGSLLQIMPKGTPSKPLLDPEKCTSLLRTTDCPDIPSGITTIAAVQTFHDVILPKIGTFSAKV